MSIAGVGTTLRNVPLPFRALAVLAVIAVAYNYSLLTLARGLSLQTPLAYLALVPVISIALAWVRVAREPIGPPIHDRQVDYIVGVALVFSAGVISLVVPITLTSRFWLYRVDLLSLPLFVAGIVALVYGVRRLWALRVPIAFLFLAWPLPYAPLVGDGMQLFTDLTASALTLVNHVIPLATTTGGDEAVFFIRHAGFAFPLSVGAACAGVNSLVGFILIGGALSYVVDGPWMRRILWLFTGLVVVWLLNVARIELIFFVGALYGKEIALDVLHPIAGLIAFNIGVFAMLLTVSRFGLRFVRLSAGRSEASQLRSPVRRVRAALVLGVVAALSLGVLNASFAKYEEIATPLGQALLVPFDIRAAQLADWQSGFVASNPTGKQYFGQSSTWDRLQYTSTAGSKLQSSLPVYVDVITTDDAGSFAAYGLQACYAFHGYQIESTTVADIGAGVQGQVIDYRNARLRADWSALWWEWPYQEKGATRYERIVIFVASGPRGVYAGGATDVPAAENTRFTSTDRFLVAMARGLVASQIKRSASS